MKTLSTYSVVFQDGSVQSGLSYDEADEAMKQGEESGNPWIRVYVDKSANANAQSN